MAYSSVEHMGIMALGFGFGGPLGIAGALYHMLNHSLNKSLMFFGAGNAMRAYGTKRIAGIADVMGRLPAQGALWLAGAAAITGAPPFGLFLSELAILRAGWQASFGWVVCAMALLLIVIFIAFLNHFRIMYYEEPRAEPGGAAAVPGMWCIVPMWLALLPLAALGIWWPQAFSDYFALVSQALAGGRP
jgi:hydrogenase-4 component F